MDTCILNTRGGRKVKDVGEVLFTHLKQLITADGKVKRFTTTRQSNAIYGS